MCMSTVLTHSSLGSLTPYIRGNRYVLTTETNLYILQLFYSLNSMLYTYNLQPYTILIYLAVTYLCYHLSFALCVHVSPVFLTFTPSLFFLLSYAGFTSYLYMIYEC